MGCDPPQTSSSVLLWDYRAFPWYPRSRRGVGMQRGFLEASDAQSWKIFLAPLWTSSLRSHVPLTSLPSTRRGHLPFVNAKSWLDPRAQPPRCPSPLHPSIHPKRGSSKAKTQPRHWEICFHLAPLPSKISSSSFTV